MSNGTSADPDPEDGSRFGRVVLWIVRGRPNENDRPALPAGHPVTWGALVRGTTLEGQGYPFPVFDV